MKALLLDFGGTLDSDGRAWKDRFSDLLESQGIRIAPETFDRAFYATDDALTGSVARMLSLSETVAQLAENLSRRLPELDSGRIRAAGRSFVADARRHFDRNRPLLARLAKRFRLAVVSNSYGNIDGILAEAGLADCFEAAIDSAVIGASKPDPRIFLAALSALDVAAGDAVMVGDSRPRDMEGARAVGIPHIWLRGSSADGPPCCPGDSVISTFLELEGEVA